MKGVQYKRMSRPFFPADAEMPGLQPTLLLATGR